MTTLIKSYPYTQFLLGKIAAADLKGILAADLSGATEVNGTITVGGNTVDADDFARAIQQFTPTEPSASQDVSNLAGMDGQSAPGRGIWEAPCQIRLYKTTPSDDSDSDKLSQDHAGYWLMYVEHEVKGKMVAAVHFDAFTEPFNQDGELVVSFTLRNAGARRPKWVD